MRLVAGVATSFALVAGTLGLAGAATADPGGMVISELHYHPGSDLDTDEFLELVNTGGSPINMSGWTFTEGITATLPAGSSVPAGGYFVISPDPTRFQQIYGFVPDATYSGSISNGGETVTLTNGATVIDTVTYDDADPWTAIPDGSGPSLELRQLLSDNNDPDSWGPSTVDGGTPRAVNSINGTSVPPRAKNVSATPQQPNPGQNVVISAKLPVGSTASLKYKVMFGSESSVNFRDNAASPGGAGDGVYAGTIPGQGAGQLIRYRIEATSGGVPFTHPASSDTINYEGVVVKNPSVVTQLPVLEWFMPNSVYDDILANHRYDDVTGPAVIAYDGQVVDNAAMRVRGQTSRDNAKVNWKIELPSGHLLDMTPNFPYPVDEFALQSDVVPKSILAWDTVGEAGARRIGIFTARSQRNGDFFSVGEVMQTEDGTWRKAQDVDNWAIYKGNDGGLATKPTAAQLEATVSAACPLCEPEQWLEKKEREDEDYTDVWQLTQAVAAGSATPQQKAFLFDNVNIPELVNYMAINTVMRHQDSNYKNWYVSRDTEGTGRWDMWHWDLNRTWTTLTKDKGPFLSPAMGNKLLNAAMRDPDISAMFYRRLRTLTDQFLDRGDYEARWDAEVGTYMSDWALERARWGGIPPSLARERFVAVLEDRRTIIGNNTGAGKPVPTSQAAAPNVVINEIQYQPVGGTDAEFIELSNPSTTTSVDISGWTFDGIDLTIQPGTVLLPRGHVVFVKNDVTFGQTYSHANRFVGGEYGGDLSNSGETIRLLQGTRVVDTVSYGTSSPWPSAAAGTGPSLELGNMNADNSLASSWSANSTSGGTPSKNNTSGGPAPTIVFSDTFTGANGSAWKSEWSTNSNSNGSTTIQSNAGLLAVNNAGGAFARARLDGAAKTTDSELLFSYQWNSGQRAANYNVFLRGSGGWKGKLRPKTGYGLQIRSHSGKVAIKRMNNGSMSTLNKTAGAQQVGSNKQWLRLQVVGSTIRYRIWTDGQPEPSGWEASVTDGAVSGSGKVFMALLRTNSATEAKSISIDNLELTNL